MPSSDKASMISLKGLCLFQSKTRMKCDLLASGVMHKLCKKNISKRQSN